ncbi:MAG: ABC transporter transmembrane domain-containing protein [Verrucomicrobia bacterium]|nr:ABC transporter transmembrane domain-containing protein [Verrucomicrobiota bacterium]
MVGEDGENKEASGSVKRVSAMAFYGYLNRYRAVFLPSLVALFLTAGLSLAFPYYLSSLIGSPSEAFRNSEEVDVAAISAGIDRTVLTLIGILALQAFISYWRVRGFISAGESALNDIRRDVFSRLLRLRVEFFQSHRAGELSGRVAADLGVLRETLLTTVPQLARQTVILVGGLVFIFVFSWKLSLFMLAMIPVVVLAVALFGRKVRGYSTAAQDSMAESTVVVEESVSGIAEVKAYSNEVFEEERYSGSLVDYLAVVKKGARVRAGFLAFIIFVLFGTIAVVAWFGAGMLARGEIGSREFTGFILFSVFVGASLGSFPEIISQVQKANGATERLREILGEEPEPGLEGGAAESLLSGAVEGKGLRFAYPSRKDVQVLDGVSFAAQAGERIAFVGPSGGGKSTLFSLLLGFYEVDGGELLLDGRSATEWSLKARRGAMALVPQDVLLFGGSIRENIAYGRPGATEEEIVEAAKKAYAHDFIAEFPEGYKTLVGPRGVKLSGGQRQRIAIARAILADPKILLLDEATSALDSESERLVQAALEELMKGRTSLIIAHRLGTVKNADRIYVLQNGRIAETGRHEELIAAGGTYRVLAETQLL